MSPEPLMRTSTIGGSAPEALSPGSAAPGGDPHTLDSVEGRSFTDLGAADKALLHALRCESHSTPFFDSFDSSRRVLFLKQAMKHHVAPLVYLRLKRAAVPAACLRDFRVQYLRNSERNLRMFHELSKALRALEDAGIPVLLLKGCHLSQLVYRNTSARVLADADLLFRAEDFARAQRTLYCTPHPCSERVHLDLHNRLEASMTRRPIDMSGVWERSVEVTIGSIRTRVLAPEDLLVHLTLHLAFHHRFEFGALRTFCDFREIIIHYGKDLDWEKVFARAEEWGSEKPLCLALTLARELVGVELPEGVLFRLRKTALPDEVFEWSIGQIFRVTPVKDALSPYFWKLISKTTLREKIVLLMKLFFACPESISERYLAPVRSVRNYLFYAVRVKENALPYAQALWRMWSGDERMSGFRARQQRSVAMMEWLSQKE